MWSVILEAYPPTSLASASATIGGAFATVFVDEPYEAIAEQSARSLVQQHGWSVASLDSIQWVEREDFPPGSPGRASYDQAATDGICATFHEWPADAPDSRYGVAIVVDPAFGDRLDALARRIHVWIADTPVNRIAAERVWAQSAKHDLERGATIFRVNANEEPESWYNDILATVIEHHGEFSHDPPLTVIEIIGCGITDGLRSKLVQAGFSNITGRERNWRAASLPAV